MRLREAGVHLKSNKCAFAKQQLKFLGHVVSSTGLSPDPDKTRAVQQFPEPSDLAGVRSFLGLASYYRRFIKDFATIGEPLFKLSRKHATFEWSDDCERAFQTLKLALVSPPVLAFPDFSCPFEIHTDASDVGLGVVLTQRRDGEERVVSYASRVLNSAERNYSVTERECLAVVFATKIFRPYLLGRPFKAFTDHQALHWLLGQKEPKGRLARWVMLLQEFDFTVQYRPGKSNADADALSRFPITSINSLTTVDEDLPLSKWRTAQLNDPECMALIQFLKSGGLPDGDVLRTKVLATASNFVLQDDLLYRISTSPTKTLQLCLVTPESLVAEVLWLFHNDSMSGHLGLARTYDRIRRRFYWPNMYRDTAKYVQTCTDCATRKTPRRPLPGLLQPITVTEPFHTVGVDILGPLPETSKGNKYALVFSDYFTKWVEVFAIPSMSAQTVAQHLLDDIVCRYGAPQRLLSDRGKNFLSSTVRAVCDILGIKKVNTTAYHPQTDGIVERFNKTLCDMLAMYVSTDQKDWDVGLPSVLFAYRTSLHPSINESPYFLMFGREPFTPTDASLSLPRNPENEWTSIEKYRAELVTRLTRAWKLANDSLQRAHENQKRTYDQRHPEKFFEPGDRVWLFVPAVKKGLTPKLAHRWHGPYRVEQRIGNVNYSLRNVSNRKLQQIVHVQRLKPYYEPIQFPTEEPELEPEDPFDPSLEQTLTPSSTTILDPAASTSTSSTTDAHVTSSVPDLPAGQFHVDRLLDMRRKGRGMQYLVKWAGYEEPTWEPSRNISDDLIQEYHAQQH
jgi:transposase InsO family protein